MNWGIKDIARWIWWHAYYTPIKIYWKIRPTKIELATFLNMCWRTRPPWAKFKPNAYYNEDGKEWEIYLEDLSHYAEERMVPVTLYRDHETDRITGLCIWAEVIENADEWCEPFPWAKFKQKVQGQKAARSEQSQVSP